MSPRWTLPIHPIINPSLRVFPIQKIYLEEICLKTLRINYTAQLIINQLSPGSNLILLETESSWDPSHPISAYRRMPNPQVLNIWSQRRESTPLHQSRIKRRNIIRRTWVQGCMNPTLILVLRKWREGRLTLHLMRLINLWRNIWRISYPGLWQMRSSLQVIHRQIWELGLGILNSHLWIRLMIWWLRMRSMIWVLSLIRGLRSFCPRQSEDTVS